MQSKFIIRPEIESLYVGLNWGATKEKGWFDGEVNISVDLDLGAFIIKNNRIVDRIFFAKSESTIANTHLSHDDNTGDLQGNDDLDNEIITVNFNSNTQDTYTIIFFIMSYTELEFGKIPYVQCRIYDGFPNEPAHVYMQKDYAVMEGFEKATSVVIGELKITTDSSTFIERGDVLYETDLRKIEVFIANKYKSPVINE